MVSVNDAQFILQAARQGFLKHEQGRRLLQTLSSGPGEGVRAGSAYRLSVDYGYLTQEQAAHTRAMISDFLGGPDWEPEDLLRELTRISPPEAAPLSLKAGRRSRGKRGRRSKASDGDEPTGALAALVGGFLRNLGVSLAFAVIVIALGLLIFRTPRSQPAGPAKRRPRPRTRQVDILERMRDSRTRSTVPVDKAPVDEGDGKGAAVGPGPKDDPDDRSAGGLGESTFEDSTDWGEEVDGDQEERMRKSRVLAAQGDFRKAFQTLGEIPGLADGSADRPDVKKQIEQIQARARSESGVLRGNFEEAVARNQPRLARSILDQAGRYTRLKGLDELTQRWKQCQSRLAGLTPEPSAKAPNASELASFYGKARKTPDGSIEVEYDFAGPEQAQDWWSMGMLGRVEDGAMEVAQANLAWPGSTWLIHKGEFAQIRKLEFKAKVNHLDNSERAYLGWGLHLAPVPEGPWDTENLPQGGIGWLMPDRLGFWGAGSAEWTSSDSGVVLEKDRTYHFVVEFADTVAVWSVDGVVLRRVPIRLKDLGCRAAVMVGGGAVRIDSIRLVATPDPEWLHEEFKRSQGLSSELKRTRELLDSGDAVELARDGILKGFCYNPRQYCLECPSITDPAELCVRDRLGPLIPARLPVSLKEAELTGKLKPVRGGARDWYFSFLQGGVRGYSLALYVKKNYLGLFAVESMTRPPSVQPQDEVFNLYLAEEEYHPFCLRFHKGEIAFAVGEDPILKSPADWKSGGELTLGGYDWGGAGHYHLRDLRLKPLEQAVPDE